MGRGKLPPTLKAFYEDIGWIDFPIPATDEPWPEEEELDALSVIRLSEATDEEEEEDDDAGKLVIFADPLTKVGVSGSGPMYVDVATRDFDPVIYFMGSPMKTSFSSPLRFVEYLRECILVRGGIGPFGSDNALSSSLVKTLTAGLVDF